MVIRQRRQQGMEGGRVAGMAKGMVEERTVQQKAAFHLCRSLRFWRLHTQMQHGSLPKPIWGSARVRVRIRVSVRMR